MKKLLIITTVLMLFASTIHAQADKGIKFETGSLKQILAKAKTENKLVFIDVYASWCGPCKDMAKNIFPEEVAGKYFNANFINAKFDAEKGEGIDIATQYKVRAYPTFLILDAQGKLVAQVVGGSSSADDFIARIKKAAKK